MMIYVLVFLIGAGIGYGIAGVQYTKVVTKLFEKVSKSDEEYRQRISDIAVEVVKNKLKEVE